MRRIFSATILTTIIALVAGISVGADPVESPTTQMTERGKLIFSDSLNQPFGSEWKVAKGKWEVVEGTMKGCELKADMHGAVTRHAMDAKDVIIQYRFKLDGAKATTLSINGTKGHICRVAIRPTGFTVQKDDTDGKNGPDKAEQLETCETPIKVGEWHTMVLEVQGKEMLATLDGKHVAYGKHNVVETAKANLGLTVAGEFVYFKDLKVWEAKPHKDWETRRAKLRPNVKQ